MKVLVTGGGGFLGQAIVARLLARGDHVRSLARNYYPALEKMGVDQIQGDISDAEIVAKACDTQLANFKLTHAECESRHCSQSCFPRATLQHTL